LEGIRREAVSPPGATLASELRRRLSQAARPERAPVGWTSRLELPGGRAQLVVNGEQAMFLSSGAASGSARLRPGANRFELVVVDAAGAPGRLLFELLDGILPGSLRVVAGEGDAAGDRAVWFALRGRPGERVVFAAEGPGGNQER
jgi:hypothetical protein